MCHHSPHKTIASLCQSEEFDDDSDIWHHQGNEPHDLFSDMLFQALQ